jgi:tetratricopeptide (TPR) repeat protein
MIRQTLLAAALVLGATAAHADTAADCKQTTDRAKAMVACTTLLKDAGKDNAKIVEAYVGRATAALGSAKPTDALADLSKAIGYDPKNADLWLKRGNVRALLGQKIRAAADYSIAAKYDPKSAPALAGRAEMYRLLGALPRAISDSTDALKLDPKSVSALSTRAFAQQRLGRDKEAVADADEAIKLDGKSMLAYLARGLAQMKADPAKATTDLKKVLELEPKSQLAAAALKKLGG